MPAAGRERLQHIVGIPRQDHADWHHAVVAGIGGIHPAVAAAEPYFSPHRGAQFELEAADVDTDRVGRAGLQPIGDLCWRAFRRDLDQRVRQGRLRRRPHQRVLSEQIPVLVEGQRRRRLHNVKRRIPLDFGEQRA